jgi:hypothetical protein
MLMILDLIGAILDWKAYTAPRSKRRIRSARRTSRGFVVQYYR